MTIRIVFLGIILLSSPLTFATTYTVSEGMKIQAMIDKAVSGDTVQVLPGTYSETIRITTPGLRVIGMEFEGVHATLDGLDKDSTLRSPLAISIEADDVVCEGFYLRNVSSPGIQVLGHSNITLGGFDVEVAGDYGIQIEDAVELTLSDTTVRGADEVGIALRRTQGAIVSRCEVYRNRIGVEITDGVKTRVEDMSVHTNGMGMIIANSSGDESKAEYTTVTNSRFQNIGVVYRGESESAISNYIPGVGIRIIGAMTTEIARCYFENVGSVGVITEQWDDDTEKKPLPSSHTYVHHNYYGTNGLEPSSAYTAAFPAFAGGDLYWDGEGRRNQWQESENPWDTSSVLKVYPEKLITKFGGVHTNVMHFQ
jgi:hypothetical protein